jgi:hypothetical protein
MMRRKSHWAVSLAAALILATTGCTVALGPDITREPRPKRVYPCLAKYDWLCPTFSELPDPILARPVLPSPKQPVLLRKELKRSRLPYRDNSNR